MNKTLVARFAHVRLGDTSMYFDPANLDRLA
jgi:hypothetical protein